MANRTTIDAIEEIMNTASTASQRTAGLAAANALVDDVFSGSGLSDSLLEQIELWLAAHFTAIMTRQKSAQSAGKASVTYQSKVDFKLKLTHYGQQALLLDTSGLLETLQSRRRKASLTFVGADVSEELTGTTYDDYTYTE